MDRRGIFRGATRGKMSVCETEERVYVHMIFVCVTVCARHALKSSNIRSPSGQGPFHFPEKQTALINQPAVFFQP